MMLKQKYFYTRIPTVKNRKLQQEMLLILIPIAVFKDEQNSKADSSYLFV